MKLALSLLASALVLATTVPVLAAGNDKPAAQAQSTAGAVSNGNSNSGPGNVTASDPQSVLDALSAAGYVGKLDKMDSGRASISVKISGVNTFIDFYDCDADMTHCQTLLFNVGLDLKDGTTLEEANKWNSDQITGRVWLDKSNDPTLDFSLSTYSGVSADTFEQTLKLWDSTIGDFKDFFHF